MPTGTLPRKLTRSEKKLEQLIEPYVIYSNV